PTSITESTSQPLSRSSNARKLQSRIPCTWPAAPPHRRQWMVFAQSPKAQFVTLQPAGQWLSSQFVGQPVSNDAGQSFGNITDLLFDKGGRIAAGVPVGLPGSGVKLTMAGGIS